MQISMRIRSGLEVGHSIFQERNRKCWYRATSGAIWMCGTASQESHIPGILFASNSSPLVPELGPRSLGHLFCNLRNKYKMRYSRVSSPHHHWCWFLTATKVFICTWQRVFHKNLLFWWLWAASTLSNYSSENSRYPGYDLRAAETLQCFSWVACRCRRSSSYIDFFCVFEAWESEIFIDHSSNSFSTNSKLCCNFAHWRFWISGHSGVGWSKFCTIMYDMLFHHDRCVKWTFHLY